MPQFDCAPTLRAPQAAARASCPTANTDNGRAGLRGSVRTRIPEPRGQHDSRLVRVGTAAGKHPDGTHLGDSSRERFKKVNQRRASSPILATKQEWATGTLAGIGRREKSTEC